MHTYWYTTNLNPGHGMNTARIEPVGHDARMRETQTEGTQHDGDGDVIMADIVQD